MMGRAGRPQFDKARERSLPRARPHRHLRLEAAAPEGFPFQGSCAAH